MTRERKREKDREGELRLTWNIQVQIFVFVVGLAWFLDEVDVDYASVQRAFDL